jgi:hypothetical protein
VSQELAETDRARLAAAQRLVLHVVELSEPRDLAESQARGLSGHGLAAADAAALAASDPRRLLVYRRLVRSTLRETIGLELPRTRACMGEAAFGRYVDAFCSESPPRSPILRDAAYELAAWAIPRFARDGELPPHLGDLARYELFEFDVYTAERHTPPTLVASEGLDPELGVCFDTTTRVARLDHAVHQTGDSVLACSGGVLGYRDGDGRFRQLDLTPMATTLLALLLLEHSALGAAIQRACLHHGQALDERVIEGTAQVLSDLAERGVVLGSQPRGEAPPSLSPWASWLFGPDRTPLAT